MPPETVRQINPSVIQRAYQRLAKGSPYYIYEKGGRDSIRGCALRVHRTKVDIGLRREVTRDGKRATEWVKVGTVTPDLCIEEVEALRDAVRRKARELEDEDREPSLKLGRYMTLADLWREYEADYVRRRDSKRSPRTLAHRRDLWGCHLLPLFGHLTLQQFASLPPETLQGIPEAVACRVRKSRSWADGRHTGNHALAALRMAWEFARRRGWIAKDPLMDIDELDVKSAAVYLEDADLGAVGEALRELEARAKAEPDASRQIPGIRALLALRVVLYTGCRHVDELCRGKLSWLRTDFGVPRLEIPRAKGERGGAHGRFLYLGPDALRCLKEMPRDGCDDLVPGRFSGTQLARLTDTWERVILEARRILEADSCKEPSAIMKARIVGYEGEKRVAVFNGPLRIPVKVTRHTIKTIHPRAGIQPDHSRQLLGHEAASLGDRVYLHQHGPSLARAAEQAETFIRRLMGDMESTVLRFRKETA